MTPARLMPRRAAPPRIDIGDGTRTLQPIEPSVPRSLHICALRRHLGRERIDVASSWRAPDICLCIDALERPPDLGLLQQPFGEIALALGSEIVASMAWILLPRSYAGARVIRHCAVLDWDGATQISRVPCSSAAQREYRALSASTDANAGKLRVLHTRSEPHPHGPMV